VTWKINGQRKIAPDQFPEFAMINEGDDYSTAGNGSSDNGSVIYSMGLKWRRFPIWTCANSLLKDRIFPEVRANPELKTGLSRGDFSPDRSGN
jgi:hypothetical protein